MSEQKKALVCPSICTSLRCGEPPQPHCRNCSHAIYKGTATINRRTYRWEHNPKFGPLFSKRKAGNCDWTPHERHLIWDIFQHWHDRKFGKANAALTGTESVPSNGVVGQEVTP